MARFLCLLWQMNLLFIHFSFRMLVSEWPYLVKKFGCFTCCHCNCKLGNMNSEEMICPCA